MNAKSPEWHDENDDDEATLPASGGAIAEIRAEAARVRDEGDLASGAFDPSDDPTTVMAMGKADTAADDRDPDLAEEPTIISFDPAHDITVIESFDEDSDLTTGAFDPSDDPTAVMAESATALDGQNAQTEPDVWVADTGTDTDAGTAAAVKVATQTTSRAGSLIDGKTPPAAATSYWDRGEISDEAELASASSRSAGKGPVPKWFIATSLLAVLMAVGLVLLVLWALSGSTA